MPQNYVLHVVRSASGQMGGRLYESDLEIGAVAGCSSVDEVIQAVHETYGVELNCVVDAQTGEGLGRLFRHHVFPERDDASGRLASYCICPSGFVPPGPDQLWGKVDVSRELLDVHSIFRRAGWYFFRPYEPENYVVRFACRPDYNDHTSFLISALLKLGFPEPPNLPPHCYYLPDLPPELLTPHIKLAEKLVVVESMMQVPPDFEAEFSYTLRKAIETAIAKGIWPFWNEN